jgi:hypothetical protein
MLRRKIWFCVLCLAGAVSNARAAEQQEGVYADPAKTDADFAIQGEYAGELGSDIKVAWGIQIIALGKGKFHAVGYPGGLPGDGWIRTGKLEGDSDTKNGAIHFGNDMGGVSVSESGELIVHDGDGDMVGKLKRVERKSPTLGEKPPAGAIVLFDGKNADAFPNGRVTEDGLLVQGVTSKQLFPSCTLHLEFRTPYMPAARGQGRGNSGCYLQGRYETQILDSFGLEGKDNECGGIYSIKAPDFNMCFPPLSWQTYDIDFVAAKFDDQGKKAKNGTMTVKHNGVVIHQNVELTHATTAAPVKEGPEPGPLYLQDHGNPVRFRNIWLVEKE